MFQKKGAKLQCPSYVTVVQMHQTTNASVPTAGRVTSVNSALFLAGL